jgi:thioredoxin 1
MSIVLSLTDENFDQYFTEAKLLVIDFWAPWCAPCKGFTRVFHEVAAENAQDGFYFGSVNVDEEKTLAKDFNIGSVPTCAIIRNQLMVFIQSGEMPKQALKDLIQQAVDLPTS